MPTVTDIIFISCTAMWQVTDDTRQAASHLQHGFSELHLIQHV